MSDESAAPVSEDPVIAPPAAASVPIVQTDADARRAAAIAKIDAIVNPPLTDESEPVGETAPETPVPDGLEATSAPPSDPRLTTLQASLVRKDRELQMLKAAAKGSITLEQLQADPLAALRAAGHSPDKLLDLWLGTPTATARPDGEQRTPEEIIQLRQQVQQMGAYLQQQQEQAKAAQASQQQQQALQTVHGFVTAEGVGDRWETIAARAQEAGLAENGGGAYHLAVEVGNILVSRALEQLGPGALHHERAAAASAALEEALDKVEAYLMEDARKRQESYARVKKLQGARAEPTQKSKGKAMPAAPSSETKPPRPLTMEERRKKAIRAVEALERKGS